MISMLMVSKLFGQKIIEDPNVEQRIIDSSFNAIKIHGSLIVWLSQDGVESVAVSADKVRDVQAIRTTVRNGVLHITGGTGKGKGRGRVYLSFKTLRYLELSGITSLEVVGSIQEENLDLKVSGISQFTGAMALQRLKVDVGGVSKAHLSGKASFADIDVSGTSGIEASDLETEQCAVVASGVSNANVSVSGKLTARASGSSEVIYHGGATVEQTTSGASIVRKEK